MGRSLEPRSQTGLICPKLGTELAKQSYIPSLDASGIADKLQFLDLGDQGEAPNYTTSPQRAAHRLKSRWSSMRMRRRRRVRLHIFPVLRYLRTFRQSMACSIAVSRRMDPRLPGSKLGVFLAKLHISSHRARRIVQSCRTSNYQLDDQAGPLLLCDPSLPVAY